MKSSRKSGLRRGPGVAIRNKTFRKYYGLTVAFLVCALVGTMSYSTLFSPPDTESTEIVSSRNLLSSGGEVLPGFSGDCAAISKWEDDCKAIVHLLIVIYLFLGIAVICDEQFTSSLECICDSRTGLGLSPDVAGATFMAAGSSAPELASSFMGTFISKSDVGLGTIIGSAVFNILVIIGATAIVVGETMQLDWKPLVRDNLFYMGSVILLILFVAPDNLIEAYDAAILLVYYALYIVFMYFNTGIMRWVARKAGEKEKKKESRSRRPSFSSGVWATHTQEGHHAHAEQQADPSSATEGGAGTGSGTGRSMVERIDPVECSPVRSFNGTVSEGQDSPTGSLPAIHSTGSGNGGPVETEMQSTSNPLPQMGEPAGVPADEAPKGDVEAPAQQEDGGEEKKEEEEEEESMGEKICNICGLPFVYLFMFTMPDCKYEEPDDDGADEEIAELQGELADADANRKAEIEEQIASLEKQKDLRAQIEDAEDDEDDAKAKALREELYPLYEPLNCGQRYYIVTFGVSLLWITILSYFMVVLMEKIGCVWGISSFIMGITFLAMGTSVPDALGSISVAKDGEGDMAVSNAIGSNVFDICMGLGLPWLIATLIDGEGRAIKASTESILASTCILFGVVFVLFLGLFSQKHPDTGKRFVINPKVGYILFVCYGAFVIFQIVWTSAGLPE